MDLHEPDGHRKQPCQSGMIDRSGFRDPTPNRIRQAGGKLQPVPLRLGHVGAQVRRGQSGHGIGQRRPRGAPGKRQAEIVEALYGQAGGGQAG